MATVALSDYLPLVAAVKKAPQRYLRSSYDAEAAALYISFKKPSVAEDGEMTEDDVILRYEGDVRPVAAVPHWNRQRKMWAQMRKEGTG